jgi:hypothetical protein
MTDSESKMVFGVSPDGQGDGVPVVLLGIPTGAWEYMRDGKTHSFDLTKIGVPIKILLYGAKDHSAAMKMVEGHMSDRGLPYRDARREDFAIKPKRPTDSGNGEQP